MDGYYASRVFLPFCIQRLEDGRYIVLNRRYKPLGDRGDERVAYENHPSAARITITPEDAKNLSWDGCDDVEFIQLYDKRMRLGESAEHLLAYQIRLAVFMQLWVGKR